MKIVIINIILTLISLQYGTKKTHSPWPSPPRIDISPSWWYPHIMRCLSPVEILNPNHGLLPYAGRTMFVPCGKCTACLSQKRQAWSFRLQQEMKHSTSAYFITLTYDDDHVPERVKKEDVQKFLKRFRKSIAPFRIRYFLVAEYGETHGRPHYHLLLFNYPGGVDTLRQELKETWKLCAPEQFDMADSVGTVTPSSISYVCKYCLANVFSDNPDDRTFMLCSRRPGIGLQFLTPAMSSYLKDHIGEMVKEEGGIPLNLPRYYERVFTPQERIKMRIVRAVRAHENENARRMLHKLENPAISYEEYTMQEAEEFDRRIRSKLKNGINQQILKNGSESSHDF